jgi:hypothetical protein
MCLERVNEKIPNPTTLILSGWKQFGGTDAKPKFEAFAFKGSGDVPLDKWITAESKVVSMGGRGSYDAGFHIFEDETELKGVAKRRVYYRNVHTRGIDRSKSVVIAREMYVPSDSDAWPPRS